MKKLYLFFGAIFSFIALSLSAQIPLSREVEPDHLSNPHVKALAEDEDGFIWAGTSLGLNRYNGTSYTYYFSEEGGLKNDDITWVLADTDVRVWVGHEDGIQLLRGGKVDPSFYCPAGHINCMSLLDEGHLLFSTRDGLYILDKSTAEFHPVYQNRRLFFNMFIRLSDGNTWICDYGSRINTLLDSRWRVIREFPLMDDCVGPYENADGDVYFFSSSGKDGYRKYSSRGEALPSDPSLDGFTRGKKVAFYVRKEGEQFLGITDDGIYKINPDGTFSRKWTEETHSVSVECTPLLTGSNLWLGTSKNTLTNLYQHSEDHILDIPSPLASHYLNSIHPLGGKDIMVLTNTELYRQNVSSKEITGITGDKLEGNHKIGLVLHDRTDAWWIQIDNFELRKYLLDGDRMVTALRTPIESTQAIWDDASGNVLILQSDGVHRISPGGSVTVIPTSSHPEFWYCGQFSSGRVYFLANDDIWFLGEEGRFYPLESDVPSPTCVYEDTGGIWWIGSRNDGLWKYNPKSKEAVQVDAGFKDIDMTVRSVTGDGQGNIWVALRFDFLKIDKAGTVTYYNSPDNGLSLNYSNCISVLDDGTPVSGSNFRLLYFPQNEVDLAPEPIPLFLDKVFVNGDVIEEESLENLNHRTRQISFFFSGKNFDPYRNPVYQYFLEGYDKDWLYAGKNLQARYSGVLPGAYTFRVRVRLDDGSWSPEELSLPLRIKPSPWLSLPALLLYALLAMVLIFMTMRQLVNMKVNREKLEISEQEKLLLEQISQERMNFFTDVSHEFRTPLSLIYGPVSELEKSSSLSEKDRRLVHIIDKNSQRMLRLTDQLLHFNRSRSSRESLSVMRTDLAALLRQMMENFAYMYQQKSLRVSTDFRSELVVYCDREKVEKIVFNLLSNAIKYTPEHGEITLKAVLKDNSAVVSVSDTGIGISPDKAERIFARYERLGEQVGGDLPTGFGIGLNYARHLAVLHKGTLEVAANDPIGSVFTFVFPTNKETYESDVVWNESESASSSDSFTPAVKDDVASGEYSVLVVEDNADMRDYIRTFLSEWSHVTMAGNGEEAWKLIRISNPDLVISDVMMPFKDGYTLCKEIKNDPEYCHIPVILLTAKADMDNQLHGLELGADGYLGKPFDPSYLTALAKNILSNRKRIQGILADPVSSRVVDQADISPQDKTFLSRCLHIIDEHIQDEEFNVNTLSMELGMSRTSVYNKIVSLTGLSPQAYLTNYRLNKAMDLLNEHKYYIGEIAYKVGFSTHTGFSRAFRNKFGVSPSQFAQEQGGEAEGDNSSRQ